jgi:uncharacterized membrane protein
MGKREQIDMWARPALVAVLGISTVGCGGVAGGLAGSAIAGALAGGALHQPVTPLERAEALGGAPGLPDKRVLAMDCAGRHVVLEVSDSQAWLFLPDRSVEMTQYFFNDGLVRFGHWNSGDMNPLDMQVTGETGDYQMDLAVVLADESINLEERGTRIDCTVDRPESRFEAAKLGGADFRGLGNEPGWELVIWPDRMRLSYDYGNAEVQVPVTAPESLQDGTGSRFRGESDGQVLEVVLRPGPCHDSMSDQVFETRVSVSLDGRNFTGCGKALH